MPKRKTCLKMTLMTGLQATSQIDYHMREQTIEDPIRHNMKPNQIPTGSNDNSMKSIYMYISI